MSTSSAQQSLGARFSGSERASPRSVALPGLTAPLAIIAGRALLATGLLSDQSVGLLLAVGALDVVVGEPAMGRA